MSIEQATPTGSQERKVLLSYLTPEQKHKLVGSFVIENFWDTFNEEKKDPINRFKHMAKESIPEFIEAYQDVWDYVVEINRLDDTFVSESLEANKTFGGMSLEELKTGNRLLSLSLYSELEKDCLMALNKTILGELADNLREKYGFSNEEYQLLMTPSFETFFTKYHFDHFEYALNDDPTTKEDQRTALIANFHANDPELFDLRFAEMHFPTGENLGMMLTMQKTRLADRAAKKADFIDDREDLIAFEKLLEYDNFLDFEYRYNLEACPEYYVRKALLAECQMAGIFTDMKSPMTLEDNDFINGVNQLIALRESDYMIQLIEDVDTTDADDHRKIQQVAIEGTSEEIRSALEHGSPCLTVRKGTDGAVGGYITIIGYNGDKFVVQAAHGQVGELSSDELSSFDDFQVLRKYREGALEGINNASERYVNRVPYLDRTDYEPGF